MSWLRNLWSRIKSLFSANAHAALDTFEDPVKMADEYIRQLQEQYAEVKRGVAESMAQSTRLNQKRDQNRAEAEGWENKAAAALKKNDEELARSALERKRQYAKTAEEYAIQAETQTAQVQQLRDSLQRLESKLAEARAKRDLVKVKDSRARSQEAIGQAMRGSNAAGSMFDRIDEMGEKLDERVAKADAMAQLETDSLANRFEDLEQRTSVDDELALLKAKVSSDQA